VLDSGDLHDIDAAIVTWPLRPFASGGLDRDASGRVLLPDLANSGVQRLDPATGRYELITHHQRSVEDRRPNPPLKPPTRQREMLPVPARPCPSRRYRPRAQIPI